MKLKVSEPRNLGFSKEVSAFLPPERLTAKATEKKMVGRQFTPEEPTISTEQMKKLMVGMLEDHLNRVLKCFPFQRGPPSFIFLDFQPLGGQNGKNATEVPEEGTVSAYAFDAPWQLVLGKDDRNDLSKGWESFS